MWIIIIILICLGLLVSVFKAFYHGDKTDVSSSGSHDCGNCSTCDGSGDKCMQDRIMEKAAAEPEYFDDEELDVFKHRRSDSYTDDEAALFAEVLYTMRQDEVSDWLASLSLRGIELPDQLKDEALMLAEG